MAIIGYTNMSTRKIGWCIHKKCFFGAPFFFKVPGWFLGQALRVGIGSATEVGQLLTTCQGAGELKELDSFVLCRLNIPSYDYHDLSTSDLGY